MYPPFPHIRSHEKLLFCTRAFHQSLTLGSPGSVFVKHKKEKLLLHWLRKSIQFHNENITLLLHFYIFLRKCIRKFSSVIFDNYYVYFPGIFIHIHQHILDDGIIGRYVDFHLPPLNPTFGVLDIIVCLVWLYCSFGYPLVSPSEVHHHHGDPC